LFSFYAARAARGFGDGFAVILLPAYLTEIGYGAFRIGVVSSAALLGAALMTLARCLTRKVCGRDLSPRPER
jgi:hypothetical protein